MKNSRPIRLTLALLNMRFAKFVVSSLFIRRDQTLMVWTSIYIALIKSRERCMLLTLTVKTGKHMPMSLHIRAKKHNQTYRYIVAPPQFAPVQALWGSDADSARRLWWVLCRKILRVKRY